MDPGAHRCAHPGTGGRPARVSALWTTATGRVQTGPGQEVRSNRSRTGMGYTTLSIQVPVQGREATAADCYPKVFPDAAGRRFGAGLTGSGRGKGPSEACAWRLAIEISQARNACPWVFCKADRSQARK